MCQRHTVVGLCVYVCNSDFLKDVKTQALASAVQAQCNNISNLIVLDFWFKALFNSNSIICSPQTMLWHFPTFPEDNSDLPYHLIETEIICTYIVWMISDRSLQQLQLFGAKQCSPSSKLNLVYGLVAWNDNVTCPDCSHARYTTRSSVYIAWCYMVVTAGVWAICLEGSSANLNWHQH